MNKRVATTAVSAAVAAGMVLGLAGCNKDEPPKDFAKACKQAGGKTMREDDFESLGMAPMAFVAGKGGGGSKSGGSKSKSKSPKVEKSKKNKGWNLGSGTSHSKPKPKKKHKSDDNEWVCVKNGVELFDE